MNQATSKPVTVAISKMPGYDGFFARPTDMSDPAAQGYLAPGFGTTEAGLFGYGYSVIEAIDSLRLMLKSGGKLDPKRIFEVTE